MCVCVPGDFVMQLVVQLDTYSRPLPDIVFFMFGPSRGQRQGPESVRALWLACGAGGGGMLPRGSLRGVDIFDMIVAVADGPTYSASIGEAWLSVLVFIFLIRKLYGAPTSGRA